jgi:Methyltransferase domain
MTDIENSRDVVKAVLSQIFQLSHYSGEFLGERKTVLLGSAFAALVNSEISRMTKENDRFDGIPTMVTPRELRLLANLFSTVPIEGPVLEIGCYLGGSTAAIARGLEMGLASNRLYVIDSFMWQDPGFVTVLGRDIAHLRRNEILSDAAVEATKRGDWHLAFHEIHRSRPYYERLEVCKALIPYKSADTFDLPKYIPDGTQFGAVFIDGFKSWESTYSGMKALVPFIRPGTLLIFQDFSWCTCYWLPLLISSLGCHLLMKVDNTAVFVVSSGSRVSDGIEKFGQSPNFDSYLIYRNILTNFARSMFHSGDDVGFLLHTAQSYVLAHTFGETQEAEKLLEFIKQLCDRLGVDWLIPKLSATSFQVHQ